MTTLPPSTAEVDRRALLNEYRVLDTPREQAYDDVASLASLICGTPIAMVTLIDQSRTWFKAAVGFEGTEAPREQSFCSTAITGEGMFVVNDATADDRFRNNPFVAAESGIRFYAGAPLVTPRGTKLGMLCVVDVQPRTLSQAQLDALDALSRIVVDHLEQRRLATALAEALDRARELSGLLPICSFCKRIRDDKNYWSEVEEYVGTHTSAEFSHGICPQCTSQHFPAIEGEPTHG